MEIENSYSTVIAVPVDGDRTAGTYSVIINASMWLGGVYYYTLEYKGIDSENFVKSIGDKEVLWNQGLSIAYVKHDFLGSINLDVEYNYMYSKVAEIQTFAASSSAGPTASVNYTADLILTWHSVDIDVNIPYSTYETGPTSFEDRLQSVCFGLNGSINVEIPLQDCDEYFFFLIHSRTRLLHSVWFDARGRNLESYYQTFRLGQINIGVGYCF